MANPALKNGYMSIALELVEKIATISIPSSEMRLIWVVWRKTWGWKDGNRHKDWDWISLSQFEKLTTMKRGNVVRGLQSLVVKRILLKREKLYKFNQNYDEWVVVKRLPPVVKRILGSSQTTTRASSQTTTHKRNSKETITKDISISHTENKFSDELRKELILMFQPLNPSYKELFKRKNQALALERMIKEHGADYVRERIAIVKDCAGDRFLPRITTPIQLEEKLGQLLIYEKGRKNITSSLLAIPLGKYENIR